MTAASSLAAWEQGFASGQADVQGDWELALEDVLPNAVSALPTQVAAYVASLSSETPQVWECPKCHQVWAPSVEQCKKCQPASTVAPTALPWVHQPSNIANCPCNPANGGSGICGCVRNSGQVVR